MGWKRCDPRARARCPDRKMCELDAVFTEGSECDAFNYRCTEAPPTNADHIRAMTDEEMAGYMAKMLADYTTGLYDGSYVPSDKVVREMASELLRQLQQPCESEGTP